MPDSNRLQLATRQAPGATLDNPYSAPKSFVGGGGMRTGATTGRVWREGDVLVMDRDAELPPRCVKCNRPESVRVLRKLSWHSPWMYLLIFAGLLVYAIVAVIVSKRAPVNIGVCAEHQKRRQLYSWIAWGSFAGSIFSFVGSGVLDSGGLVGLGFLALLAAGVFCALAVRLVQPARIDDRQVRLKGVSREFLDSLSAFAGATAS
jgi:hypothetical protein